MFSRQNTLICRNPNLVFSRFCWMCPALFWNSIITSGVVFHPFLTGLCPHVPHTITVLIFFLYLYFSITSLIIHHGDVEVKTRKIEGGVTVLTVAGCEPRVSFTLGNAVPLSCGSRDTWECTCWMKVKRTSWGNWWHAFQGMSEVRVASVPSGSVMACNGIGIYKPGSHLRKLFACQ